MSDQYFALRDDVGVTAGGNLEPLVAKSLTFSVPAMMGGDVVEQAYGITIEPAPSLGEGDHARIIPGTRMIHSQDPRVSLALIAEGVFVEIDPPAKKDEAAQRKALKDAAEEAGTHSGDPDPDNPDNPVDETPKDGE
jgi:hypothetical protein